jgi:hypothetical protein
MEEIKAHLDKADVKAKARYEQFYHDRGHIETLLEGFRSCGKRTTICMVASEGCLEKSKAGPEVMNVEATPEETEAAVVWQELFKKEDKRR